MIIPARLRSTRLPEKMIASATGMPLVQHVVEQVKRCSRVDAIIVAADDEQIVAALKPFNTRVMLTDPNHPSGTDRIAEVARSIDAALLINVQGDEPEIEPSTIDALIKRMSETGSKMGTVVTPFSAARDPLDPNIVKAVLALDGSAIYFSRYAVPFQRDADSASHPMYQHLGIYAYRRDFLLEFAAWPTTPLERAEKLEQLRALEHGVRVDTITIPSAATGIDTPEQYASFVTRTKAADGRG